MKVSYNVAGGIPQETGSEVETSVQEVYWGDALGLITSGREGKESKGRFGRERSQVVMELQQKPKATPQGPLKLDGPSESS